MADFFIGVPREVRNLFFLLKQGRRNRHTSMSNWLRYLEGAAAEHPDLGAVLLLLDGDCDGETVTTPAGKTCLFCAANVAGLLAREARKCGAGSQFSLAVVFARQEYESWLIAGVPSHELMLKPDTEVPPIANLENAPRSAKGWLDTNRQCGYKPTRHQKELTGKMVLGEAARMRSFRRLDHAVRELVDAARVQCPIVSPAGPTPGTPPPADACRPPAP